MLGVEDQDLRFVIIKLQVVVRDPGIDTREHPCDQHKIKIPTVASSVTISS